MDRSFVVKNRASTERLKALVHRLSDSDMGRRVGEHWTVSITLAHIALWDSRARLVLERSEREGRLSPVEFDPNIINELVLPTWKVMQPRDAARLAIETAEALDQRLENYPEALLEQINEFYPRWVLRAAHRNEHMDEIDAALEG